jgi:hypothetical protein
MNQSLATLSSHLLLSDSRETRRLLMICSTSSTSRDTMLRLLPFTWTGNLGNLYTPHIYLILFYSTLSYLELSRRFNLFSEKAYKNPSNWMIFKHTVFPKLPPNKQILKCVPLYTFDCERVSLGRLRPFHYFNMSPSQAKHFISTDLGVITAIYCKASLTSMPPGYCTLTEVSHQSHTVIWVTAYEPKTTQGSKSTWLIYLNARQHYGWVYMG